MVELPIEIANKILLIRPSFDVHKLMKEHIRNYNNWSSNRKRRRTWYVDFKTYSLVYILKKMIAKPIKRRTTVDINDVYDWLVNVYSPDEECSVEEAYKYLMEDDLYKQYYLDHDGMYINILPKEKLNKYIQRGKKRFIKNHLYNKMEIEDAYKILNITNISSKEEVIKAYRKKYISLFPNKGLLEEHVIHNKKINDAFNTIINNRF